MHKILFHAGPFTLYSYGFFVALGFVLGVILLLRVSEKYGISRDDILDCLVWVLIGGITGGRLLFIALNFQHYAGDPLRVFMLTEGGLAVQGAIIGGIISCRVVCWFKKIAFLKTLDLLAPYVALGQSIGRIGCFFNGCCFGREIKNGLGVIFPGDISMRVPTQLYSSLGLILIFALLIHLRDKKRYDGFVFFMYCGIYSLFRFLMDYLRGDDLFSFYSFTLSQLISAAIIALSVTCLAVLSQKNRRWSEND